MADFNPACNSQFGWNVDCYDCHVISPLKNTHNMPDSPLGKNMMSSTKPEVHNVSQHHQGSTEPGPLITCTKIWRSLAMWFSSNVSRQTDRHTYHNNLHPSRAKQERIHIQHQINTFPVAGILNTIIAGIFLGHLSRDDLINPVKMSIHPHVHTSTVKHNAATNQIVVFVLRSMRHSRRYDF